jgi:hypothetical protein
VRNPINQNKASSFLNEKHTGVDFPVLITVSEFCKMVTLGEAGGEFVGLSILSH